MIYYSVGLLGLFLFLSHSSYSNGGNLREQKEKCEVLSVDGDITSDIDNNCSLSHVFRESLPGPSHRENLLKKDRIESSIIHEVIFHIKQRNEDKIERLLYEVSDPTNLKYGQHLSREEIAEITSNPESHDYVISYLKAAGVTILSETLSGEYVTTSASIGVWEDLLDTTFFEFHHVNGEEHEVQRIIRAEAYSIPILLDKHITSAFNTIQIPMPIFAKPIVTPVTPKELSKIFANAALGYTEPALLKSYYNINNAVGNSQATQAVFATIGQYFSPIDLTAFQDEFALPRQPVASSIGGHSSDAMCINTPSNCVEGNLDLQYIMATSINSPTTFWYTNSNSFADWLVSVANMGTPPRVLSISYMANEIDVSKSEFDAFNLQAMKLGVMGVTIVAASGDDGVNSYVTRNDRNACGYMPGFPASSPYVVSVGGTQGIESGTPEIACQSNLGGGITSGGGFSTYYSQPAFQSQLVARYFSSVSGTSRAPVAGYKASGRGYPDVALAAARYFVFIGGNRYFISGTSASAPVMAGMISIVNAARLAANKKSLGWITPTLYQSYQVFTNDITSGKNNCAAGVSSPICCTEGFYAAVGWDPVTGLGSINFAPFMDFFFNFDNAVPAIQTQHPTPTSTSRPTEAPTSRPTAAPTCRPTETCTALPSLSPTSPPSNAPTFTTTLRNRPVGDFFPLATTNTPTSTSTNILPTKGKKDTKGKAKFGSNNTKGKAKGGDIDVDANINVIDVTIKGKNSGKDTKGKGKGGGKGKGKGKR